MPSATTVLHLRTQQTAETVCFILSLSFIIERDRHFRPSVLLGWEAVVGFYNVFYAVRSSIDTGGASPHVPTMAIQYK